jgi:hypothetical protein
VAVGRDISGAVETCYKAGNSYTVKRDDNPQQNAFDPDPGATPPWLAGSSIQVLNPIAP